MAETIVFDVEFIGGPFDGHQQRVSLSPEELSDLVLLPVGKILAMLHNNQAYEQFRNLAIYELVFSFGAGPSYHYVGATSAHFC